MSIIIYPTDGREYNADEASGYLATRTTGVFATEDNFNVTVSGDRSVKIGTGIAWIKDSKLTGRSVINNGDVQLSFSMADGVNDRIDRIVIHYDKEANNCYFAVLEGTPSSEPTPPDITRTDFVFELGLYTVLIKGGTTEIDEVDITSTMLDEEICGVMRDGVTGIPTAQIEAQARQLLTDIHTDADKLIDDLRDIMEQVAGTEIPNYSIGTEKFTEDAKAPFSGTADFSKNGAYLVTVVATPMGVSNMRYTIRDLPDVDVDFLDIKFVAPNDYNSNYNNPFLVNSETYTTVLQNGDILPNGFFVKDRIVTATIDFANKVINFKSSGGSLKYAKGSITIGSESVSEITIPTLFEAKYFRFFVAIPLQDVPFNSAEARLYLIINKDETIAMKQDQDSGFGEIEGNFNGDSSTSNIQWVATTSDTSFTLAFNNPYTQTPITFAPSTTYNWELWSE